ncbi:MAG TPA: AAA domain-containing protein [Deltaproteobacteria bacterium]|nr:AAA domain-containing protein [Deltaproteobacteria bacterium]
MKNTEEMNVAKNEGGRVPSQQELEKELSDYLAKKYGNRVKIISPFVVPKKDEAGGREQSGGVEGDGMPLFDGLPEELESYLDGFVVKQDQVKSVLATKICTHFNRIKFNRQKNAKSGAGGKRGVGVGMIKNNVLLIGPTGVGKTYIVKLIAQKLGVPFVKGDATKFSETGYVGGDVEDLVRDLVYEAGENIELAENGIIYVDEIDKISSSRNLIGHDISRTGVQRALLKPMEETDIDLKVPHDPISQIQAIEHYRRTGKKEKRIVNTKNILFIMSGAFGELAEIIKKRLQSQGIGFEADVRPAEVPWEILKEVRAQDLIEFGFESEFVGRLPVVVVFDELKKEDLVKILKNPNNPIIISKRLDFRSYGIDIVFEDAALEMIAEMAATEKTGARGLVSAIEKVLIPFEKKLPSTKIRRFLVSKEVVMNPESQIEYLLENSDTEEVNRRFEKQKEKERADIKGYITDRNPDFAVKSGFDLYEKRMDLIAELYIANVCDIDTALEDFKSMIQQVRTEEASLKEKLDIKISFEDGFIDEIISVAIKTDQEPGPLTFQLAQKLEYGLRLVKDRSNVDSFALNQEAVTDTENFINNLIKNTYREEPVHGREDEK